MSSRVERKTQLREARLEREREAQAHERRQKRLWLLGASAVAAIVVVAVLIAVSQSGGGSSSGGGGSPTSTVQPTTLFDGIPQHGATLGNPNAPLKMVEFVDLQCPFCAQYTRGVLPTLVQRYVRTGELSIEMRPLSFIGDDSVTAGKAAAAAADRNRLWQFADLVYHHQGQENTGYVTDAFITKIARAAGLDAAPIVAAAHSGPKPALLTQADQEAAQQNVSSTPSFLLGSRGGSLQSLEVNQLEPSAFTSQIDAALNK
jgi:protein-disulfide isomerase